LSIQTYLVFGESVALHVTDLTVDGEKKYDGYVTNRRIIFLKKNKFQEILNDHISSLQFERRRRFGAWMLVLGIALLVILVGIVLIIVWAVAKREDLVIYGGGRQIRVRGSKDKLQRLMFEGRNQLSRLQIPQTAPMSQPPRDTYVREKEVIKEVVMIPCKYCGALTLQTSLYCPHCGAPVRR